MPTYKHGISIIEQSTALQVPVESSAGLQFIVGTAPINLADNPYNATNKVFIAYSFAEACEKVGYSDDYKNYTLCQSIDACFRRFSIAPIVLVNVLDPKIHVKENEETTYELNDGFIKIPIQGILKDTLEVTNENGTTIYKQGDDFVALFDGTGNLTISFFDTTITSVKIRSKSIAPEMVTFKDIIGGYDVQTKQEKGLELIRQVYPKFGLIPGLMLAPGWSQIPEICAVMEAKCDNLNGMFSCQALVDIDTHLAHSYDDVKKAKEQLGVISSKAIVFFPKVANGSKEYFMSAMMGGLITYMDATHEDIPSHSPSNQPLRITATLLDDGTEIFLDLDQANQINSYGVCTAINVNGWRSWGNRTACYPLTTDPKDSWINVRRFFNWHGNNFILTFFDKVDNLTNYRLIEAVVDSENMRCHSLVARGHIAGAEIRFLSNENPITDIMNGTIRFHQYVTPFTPAEFIQNTLEFDPTMLQTALFEV